MFKIFYLLFLTLVSFVNSAETDSIAKEKAAVPDPQVAPFLGEPFFHTQPLFKGRAGNSIVTAPNGTVLAFQHNQVRTSRDGGLTWSKPIAITPKADGNAVVDETTGEILYVHGSRQYLWRTRDGISWVGEQVKVLDNDFGHGAAQMSTLSMQPGITLKYGRHKGRLIMPTRIFGPEGSNDVKWRAYHYSAAMYSDDGGRTWQTSKPFPVLGTGEAALAEISDGSIYYNSREHMSVGNRFIAWSDDGGDLWLNACRCPWLPDGVRGTSYGCMGGLIRLPVDGQDILVYSNLDSDAGIMPDEVGGSKTKGREKITVWASFDGARTWPVKRLVFDGPSGYSNLGVGRAGTASEGKIYLLYEGGPKKKDFAVHAAVFNLSWLLDGKDPAVFLKK